MAKIIDQREEEYNETLEAVEEPVEAVEAEDIPDKYQGKSIKDIVQMHQEAEKLLGRQSSEVGELRRIVDDFVQTQLASQQQPAHNSADEEVDFFVDPQKAVERAIANHPKIREAETVSQQLRRSEAMARLQTAHPDFQSIVATPSFIEWIGKSKFRAELLRKADQAYDFDAADELLSSWKERQAVVTETVATENKARSNQVKSASTGNVKGSAEAPSRKVYRRADIIQLMQKDPERYRALMPEIRQAYEEGRVK
jgi:hypothetical protein